MRDNIKQQLDSEVRKRKFVKIFYILLPLLLMIAIASFVFNRGEVVSSFVIGEVVNRHTQLHDEGHTNFIIVKVPTEQKLIYVRLPLKGAIKVSAKVQLRRLLRVESGKSRYILIKYVE